MSLAAFTPRTASTVTISATTTSASSAVTAGTRLLISNAGTAVAFVRFGVGAQTALVTDLPVLSGDKILVSPPAGTDTVAAITAASTATVYVTVGHGAI